MRNTTLVLLAITALVGFPLRAKADIQLGTAGNFAVLAASTVTNTGNTVIDGGDVGLSPGTSVTGFATVDGGPGIIIPPYTTHITDAVALQAQTDLTTAYNQAAGLAPTTILNVSDLSGLTLTPGVYAFNTSAIGLTGTLTLNDLGDPNAQFVFQIASTLITGSNSSVVTINGGSMPGCTVFWQVGSSATLGTDSTFEGHILAYTSISMNTGANILDGSALASTGAVTLQDNSITNCVSVASVPEPSTTTIALLGGALLGLPTLGKRLRARGRLKSSSAGSPTNR